MLILESATFEHTVAEFITYLPVDSIPSGPQSSGVSASGLALGH